MADSNGSANGVDPRIVQLTRAYRAILARYAEIEQLSCVERDLLLTERPAITSVNALLSRKKVVLAEIRDEEERVKGEREWWKRARRTLPADAGRELLTLLDAISRAVERLLGLESECRRMLERRAAWGNATATEPSMAAVRIGAQTAYGQAATAGRAGE